MRRKLPLIIQRSETMKEFVKLIDELPWIVKIILCIPVLDIVWAIYRIVKALANKDSFNLIIGIIWVIGACSLTWIFDLVTTILYKHPKLT